MKTNSVPAVIMLTAGLIDCIVSIYQRLSLFDFTKQLLIVLVIFYLLGCVVNLIRDITFPQMDDEPEIEEEDAEDIEPAEGAVKPAFGVVVATFKQVFNAKMFRKRLMEQNYPALVVQNHDGDHHVVIKGFDTDAQAAAFLKEVVKKGEVKTPIEPFILAMP